MAVTVNMHEAKTQLSRWVARAEAGEEVIIARAGKPIARLTRWEPPIKKRRFGSAKRKIRIADDFDAPVPGFEEFYQ